MNRSSFAISVLDGEPLEPFFSHATGPATTQERLVRVTAVADHYEELLAPLYLWMTGGLEAALRQGETDVEPFIPGRGLAVDLGAGFGMHSIPLARAGREVLAIDLSGFLLAQLAAFGAGLPIRPVQGDLRAFAAQLQGPRPLLILCMGDTLAHLADRCEVEALLHQVAASLAAGGRFVVTFRDYSQPPAGTARFINVRSDVDRILTCFVEPEGDRLIVHDVLHERKGDGWSMSVSAYPKSRVAPESVRETLERAGLTVTNEPDRRGLVCLHARK